MKTIKKLSTITLFLLLCSCQTLDGRSLRYVKETGGEKLPALEAVYIKSTTTIPQYWKPGERVVQQSGINADIFYAEVEKNLTNPYGELSGYIEMRESTHLFSNVLWSIPSTLTLFIPNLFGFPFASYTATSYVSIRILDKNGNLVKRYEPVSVSDTKYIALWWGYAETIENGELFKLKVFREALTKALNKIKKDRYFINTQLQNR